MHTTRCSTGKRGGGDCCSPFSVGKLPPLSFLPGIIIIIIVTITIIIIIAIKSRTYVDFCDVSQLYSVGYALQRAIIAKLPTSNNV